MKVAVAADGELVSPHFGRCEEYVVALVADGQVLDEKRVVSPGHMPGQLPQPIRDSGVECVIAGGMGFRARALCEQSGIRCILGVEGAVADVLAQLAADSLQSGEDMCGRPGGHTPGGDPQPSSEERHNL